MLLATACRHFVGCEICSNPQARAQEYSPVSARIPCSRGVSGNGVVRAMEIGGFERLLRQLAQSGIVEHTRIQKLVLPCRIPRKCSTIR
jgi:hypothetical protein